MKLQSRFFRLSLAFVAALTGALSLVLPGAAAPLLDKPGLPKAAAAAAPASVAAVTTTALTSAPAEPIVTVDQAIESPVPSALDTFAASVVDGRAGVLRGVYVPGVLALRVVQQPAGAFSLSMAHGVATQFSAASAYGVTGLLADNIASGVLFYSLTPGQEVTLIYGDGAQRRYIVGGIARYQALSPSDPYSDFVDLYSGAHLSATTLFAQMYTGGDKVTFQTCIAQDGQMAWGRHFVTAYPAP